jgi:hypothetical protein
MHGYKTVYDTSDEIVVCYEAISEPIGTPVLTTRGKIHYSKDGVHIVPARPE